MNAPATPIEPPAGDDGPLEPGVSYFQVLRPKAIRAPSGDPTYDMLGPFLDIGQATQLANAHPGSMLTVTLVLYRAPRMAAPLPAKGAPHG